jgi:pimeloyl-ACP methyl ester carboxylesterase
MKINPRKYGKPPYDTIVLHGGPGAAGEMAHVAKKIASRKGVLEPMQTATTIEGQVEELKSILEEAGTIPVTLIGWSWGAWLGFIYTALNQESVSKLILVSSGPFEERYAHSIMKTRLERLSPEDRDEVETLQERLDSTSPEDKNPLLSRFGELLFNADTYEPIAHEDEVLEYRHDIFRSVWDEASKLRRSGALLSLGKYITCPVVAIHGNYDPHPAEGIEEPLSSALSDFQFIFLEKCGHYPWHERHAKDLFFDILEREIM